MTEKQLLYSNLGGVIAFGLFVLLSLMTASTDTAQRVMVLISEIVGVLTIIGAGISLVYMKSKQKYVPISIIVFLSTWVIYGIGYEIGITSATNYKWIWFVLYYIVMIANIVLLQKAYGEIKGTFKLLPAFFLFFNAMLSIYMVFIHIWWSLPFVGGIK